MRFFISGLFILPLLFLSCRKEKTSWASNWVLPLVSDTLDLKNLVKDSILAVDGSGYYQLEINRNILDITLSDYIEIPDTMVEQKYAISAGSLNVPAGTSFVNNNKDHSFDLKGAQLKRARISSGKLKITVESPIEAKTIFTVQLPRAKKNGTMIKQTFQAPAGTNQSPSSTSATIDLSGYELDLTGSLGTGFNLLQSQMVVQSDPSGNAVTVDKYDTTKFIIRMENVKMDYARGYFGNLVVEDTTTFNAGFLDKIVAGSLDLPATNIRFIISNGIKVGARATLRSVVNTNQYGSSVALSHPQIGIPMYIEPASGSWSSFLESVRTLQFTSLNSNVEQYIENLGSSQKLSYKFELNPYGNISAGWDEFFPTSRLQVRMKAQMPLSAALNNLTIQDTFDINLKKDTDKTHIASGKLKLSVSNAFPLQGAVKIFLLGASGETIGTVNGSQLIPSSLYGTVTNGLKKSSATIYFDLSEDLLGQMDQIKKAVVRVALDTPDPTSGNSNFVLIPEGAFMAIRLGTAFQLENRL